MMAFCSIYGTDLRQIIPYFGFMQSLHSNARDLRYLVNTSGGRVVSSN